MISTELKYTNLLIHENSPYLRQHAHNPVNWFPWGEDAFQKARRENKLVLVSIGYAACHWCHVMAHECFEDEGVADIMNEHFICIKVDREERPDVDQVYMDAVQLLTNRGGWPLNCFALPDGRPVFGGTYYPKENWKQLLLTLQELYGTQPEKIIGQAGAIMAGLSDISPLINPETALTLSPSFLERYYQALSGSLDPVWGGSKGAPKFPMPVVYEFLLRYFFQTKMQEALDSVTLLLNKMASGGLYDHLGGGFARYSTDEQWIVPHFEKMLYDNAQLVSLYSKAYKITKDEYYRQVILTTLGFLEKDLASPGGAFYSSLDADSEGEEGKYYVWTKNEIDNLLGPYSELFCRNYHVTAEGNFENGRNILYPGEMARDPETNKKLDDCRKLLYAERQTRTHPGLDTKILCSWNALMVEACLDAFTALQVSSFYDIALTCAVYLEQHHLEKGQVWRVNQHGKKIGGFLDDYAFLARAFIRLFQVSCHEKWLDLARAVTDHAVEHFSDPQTGFFFYTSDEDAKLAARKLDLHDNVIPASNSVMAEVLLQLARYYEHEPYRERSLMMLRSVADSALQYAWYHAGWARLACDIAWPSFEVAVAGPDAREKVMEIESHYLPHLLICGSPVESILPLLNQRYRPGETWLYVCEDRTCRLPVDKVEVAIDYVTKEYLF